MFKGASGGALQDLPGRQAEAGGGEEMDQFLVAPVDLGSELADVAAFHACRDAFEEECADPGTVAGRIDPDHVQYGDPAIIAELAVLQAGDREPGAGTVGLHGDDDETSRIGKRRLQAPLEKNAPRPAGDAAVDLAHRVQVRRPEGA